MPIDPFKTQVLLLHSEQGALDQLGSSFDDRYTVHFATSGTQALSTLAETPINVIISVQDLPGMTGLEALREARKRLPDMVGILLTGDDDCNQALVGDEEVFQVVRGSLTNDSLLQLVDSATKKMRLATLAESANDNRALTDGSAEHVPAENDDHDRPVSTSASGRMPALDPATLASLKPVDVLVLTRDETFLQAVEASSRGLHTVHSALTLNEADVVMKTAEIGVVVIDAAMAGNKVEHLAHHLQEQAPRLVTIVAGRRDDGDMLMDLINRGKVYRFLMKPVTPGRTRLAVEAAVRHHLEAPDAAFKAAAVAPETAEASVDTPGDSEQAAASLPDSESTDDVDTATSDIPNDETPGRAQHTTTAVTETPDAGSDTPDLADPAITSTRLQKLSLARQESRAAAAGSTMKLIAFGATIAIVIIAGAWLWFSGDGVDTTTPAESTVTTPSGIESNSIIDEPVAAPEIMDIDALLMPPRSARDAGAIYDPPGINAIELYQVAVIESAYAPLAVEEFEAVISEALALAETALLENRLDDAGLALQRVTEADANNVRLPFLAAQLKQARMLEVLGDARQAIGDMRLQDAAGFLEAAEALQVADRTEIDAVVAEFDRARSAQRAEEVLALADARMKAGDLLTPPNRNARHYYELVLSNDRDNQAARQGLNVIASRLILQARASIDSGDFANADALLGEVKALAPRNSELKAATEALRAARESVAEESLPAEPGATEAIAGQSAEPVAVGSLVRTRYVAPRYPRSAQRRKVSGWVDIAFTVDVNGMVKEIEVRDSEPGDTFDNAAVRAVEKWEFEPILDQGVAIEQRAAVRMMFALE